MNFKVISIITVIQLLIYFSIFEIIGDLEYIYFIFIQAILLIYYVLFINSPTTIKKDIFNPINILFALYMIHFIGTSYYNALSGNLPTDIFSYYESHVSLLLFIMFFGFFFLVSLKKKTLNKKIQDKVLVVSNGFYLLCIFVLLGLSLLSMYMFISEAGGVLNHFASLGLRLSYFEGKGILLSLVMMSIPAALLMFIYILKQKNKLNFKHKYRNRFIFLFIFLIAVFSSIFTGSRGALLFMLLVFLFISHYAIKKLEIKKVVAFVVFVFVFLFSFIAFIRQPSLGEKILNDFSLSEIPSEIIYVLYAKGTFKELNSIARVHEGMNTNEYLYGKTLLAAITFPIPRSIYVDKPDSGSNVFTKLIRPDIWAMGRGDRVTFIGELYMNFSYLGVVIGAMLLAFVMAHYYKNLLIINNTLYGAVVYSLILVWFVVLIRSDIAISTFQLLRILMPILMVYLSFNVIYILSIKKKGYK